METSNDEDIFEPTTQEVPKALGNGHDNKVFSDERGLPHLPHPSQNGYHGHDQPPQTFRIIENSRLWFKTFRFSQEL